MKKTRNILAISFLSIILLTGVNVASACQGLTIGYWKNHIEEWDGVLYSKDQTLGEIFEMSIMLDPTLEEALSLKGGKGIEGAVRLLYKQVAAALLNIADPEIEYEISFEQLKLYVGNVLDEMSRSWILDLKDALDEWNNAGL